jgi:hypothetical protein
MELEKQIQEIMIDAIKNQNTISFASKKISQILNIKEIENKGKKELLNSYYVAIHCRDMSIDQVMYAIIADIEYLNGEKTLDEAKNILKNK